MRFCEYCNNLIIEDSCNKLGCPNYNNKKQKIPLESYLLFMKKLRNSFLDKVNDSTIKNSFWETELSRVEAKIGVTFSLEYHPHFYSGDPSLALFAGILMNPCEAKNKENEEQNRRLIEFSFEDFIGHQNNRFRDKELRGNSTFYRNFEKIIKPLIPSIEKTQVISRVSYPILAQYGVGIDLFPFFSHKFNKYKSDNELYKEYFTRIMNWLAPLKQIKVILVMFRGLTDFLKRNYPILDHKKVPQKSNQKTRLNSIYLIEHTPTKKKIFAMTNVIGKTSNFLFEGYSDFIKNYVN